MSNCERVGRKKSAAQGGRSYAKARESVAKSYKVDNLEHPSREYYYRRPGFIVKGRLLSFWEPATAREIRLAQIRKKVAQLSESRAPDLFFSSLAYFKLASA